MKYKVGDKVRVRIDLVPHKVYGSLTFLDGNMSKCAGQICTIMGVLSDKKYYVSENPFAWSEEMLEPAYADGGKIPTPENPVSIEEQLKDYSDSVRASAEYIANITGHSYETIINKFNALGCTTFRVSPSDLDELMKKTEEKKMSTKFTFYTIEGYRIDKSNNTQIPTITTEVYLYGSGTTGSATCDKTDYSERQGVVEALANAAVGNFEREYHRAVQQKKADEKNARTCSYCGEVFDTVSEKDAHEAWHVERRKARRERYLLRKRAKEIAFEEAAQKLAKEMTGDKK